MKNFFHMNNKKKVRIRITIKNNEFIRERSSNG